MKEGMEWSRYKEALGVGSMRIASALENHGSYELITSILSSH